MQIVVVGVNHKSASLDLLERVAVTPERVSGVLARLRELVDEGFVLSTCNRVELYALCGHEESGADLLRRVLAEHARLDLKIVRETTYTHGHRAAVSHALRVATGLDSMVLGETEIQGQMRRALEAGRRERALGPMLDRLGSAALACGKRARSETSLVRHAQSVASVGLRLAEQRLGTLAGARVAILGAGETAVSLLAELARVAPASITIVNRTAERAASLAAAAGVDARPWRDLPGVLGEADVVVACTSAPVPVIDASLLAAARTSAPSQPLVCVDLGVPRDIAPAVRELPNVMLIDVDDVDAATTGYRAERARDVVRVEQVVAEETERYMAWWRGRGVASTVARLHAQADAICQAELERTLARLPELSPRERAVVGEAVARVAAKLLHRPTLALKEDPEGANMALVVERLFELEPAPIQPDRPCEPLRRVEHECREEAAF
ncbi:MAG: glutamyl-tRNA reductase [Geminicoccaceae bacterium]|nr:glutamyl-tRNA reductase [Geminicoccaceae bacterium]